MDTYEINVPAGSPDLDVSLHATDDSADNVFNYYLVSPERHGRRDGDARRRR